MHHTFSGLRLGLSEFQSCAWTKYFGGPIHLDWICKSVIAFAAPFLQLILLLRFHSSACECLVWNLAIGDGWPIGTIGLC